MPDNAVTLTQDSQESQEAEALRAAAEQKANITYVIRELKRQIANLKDQQKGGNELLLDPTCKDKLGIRTLLVGCSKQIAEYCRQVVAYQNMLTPQRAAPKTATPKKTKRQSFLPGSVVAMPPQPTAANNG